jgi:hypothetical protein
MAEHGVYALCPQDRVLQLRELHVIVLRQLLLDVKLLLFVAFCAMRTSEGRPERWLIGPPTG